MAVSSAPQTTNRAGLSKNDYKGAPSTLCSGCGHDAITSQIINAYYNLGIKPWEVAKVSGIGCSSKSPTYFLNRAHGFNGVHGRMPALATGVAMANHTLNIIGVSGDGDSAAIGTGQFVHTMRRNTPMVYIIANNGVYGLTKGQFSPTADAGSKSKGGRANDMRPIDVCALAIQLGATYVGRGFSGDPKQLLTLLEGAIAHKGTALLDVISPCVTFNNHEGSTKSYAYAREHEIRIHELDLIPHFEPIEVVGEFEPGQMREVRLHDGSYLRVRKLEREFDPTSRSQALALCVQAEERQEFLTGLLYVETDRQDLISGLNVVDEPLATLPVERVRPSKAALDKIMAELA